MPLAAGFRLGPFEIVAPLGAGGMGEVYRARDTRLGRDVAIKVLPEAFALDRDRLRRFEQEARSIAALNHPHICQLHDVGPGYLVLEYVQGDVLRGPMAVEDAVRLARQIASALEAAHERGILHRDLKPANVLVTRGSASAETTAKLLDFGIAKLMAAPSDGADDATRTVAGAVIGTAAYMSPEQAEGKRLDARSDIFSFGAVVYELLSGTRAFAGQSTAQVVSAVLRDDPPALNVPPPLEGLVSRCLAKQPGRRFQTMAEVRAALEQLSAKPADRQPSIAVLPFADMSEGQDQAWFSDGLAEEIINALTHIPGLKVTARTSAFAFRGKEQDIKTIADTLRVRTILEGSIRRAGNRLRVTAQLINAEDGYHLWSERYDRDLTDIFAIQDEIARAITAALQIKLSDTPPAQERRTPNVAAYEAYLRGRLCMFKMSPDSLARSRQFFEQAIALDSDFARAHSGLGEYFFAAAGLSLTPTRDAVEQMRTAARRALQIDSSLPEAHTLLAMIASTYEFDWREAEREFGLAMAVEPVAPWARDNYGAFYLLQVGRVEDAGVEIARALQEDPLNLLFRLHWGTYLYAAGRDDEAVRQFIDVLDIDQDFSLGRIWLLTVYVAQDKWPDAHREASHLLARDPSPLILSMLAGVFHRSGDRDRSERLLEPVRDGSRPGAAIGLAIFHLVCGEVDEAVLWLEKAVGRYERVAMLPLLLRRFVGSSHWPKIATMLNLPG